MDTMEEGCKLHYKLSTWDVKWEVTEVILKKGSGLPARDSAKRSQETLEISRKQELLILKRETRSKRGLPDC